MIFEIWREWLSAALDWRYVLFIVGLIGMAFGSNQVYDTYLEGREVVDEIVHPVAPPSKPVINNGIATIEHVPSAEGIVYRVYQDVTRVLRL